MKEPEREISDLKKGKRTRGLEAGRREGERNLKGRQASTVGVGRQDFEKEPRGSWGQRCPLWTWEITGGRGSTKRISSKSLKPKHNQ